MNSTLGYVVPLAMFLSMNWLKLIAFVSFLVFILGLLMVEIYQSTLLTCGSVSSKDSYRTYNLIFAVCLFWSIILQTMRN